MQKDFMTITPDSGGGTTNITVAAEKFNTKQLVEIFVLP